MDDKADGDPALSRVLPETGESSDESEESESGLLSEGLSTTCDELHWHDTGSFWCRAAMRSREADSGIAHGVQQRRQRMRVIASCGTWTRRRLLIARALPLHTSSSMAGMTVATGSSEPKTAGARPSQLPSARGFIRRARR